MTLIQYLLSVGTIPFAIGVREHFFKDHMVIMRRGDWNVIKRMSGLHRPAFGYTDSNGISHCAVDMNESDRYNFYEVRDRYFQMQEVGDDMELSIFNPRESAGSDKIKDYRKLIGWRNLKA